MSATCFSESSLKHHSFHQWHNDSLEASYLDSQFESGHPLNSFVVEDAPGCSVLPCALCHISDLPSLRGRYHHYGS